MLCLILCSLSNRWYSVCWYCHPWSEWNSGLASEGSFANKPVSISLTKKQEAAIRASLQKVPFSRLKTSADSFVNLREGGMITEHFLCRFPLGLSSRFVSRSRREELAPLARVLDKIAHTEQNWIEISRMEAWLFTEQRWNQLHPDT